MVIMENHTLYDIYMKEKEPEQTYSDWLKLTANCKCNGDTHHDD